jgi:hypothetical protein
LSNDKPSIDVFKKREWLKLTHHNWNGKLDINDYSYIFWKKEKHRFEVVGNIPIVESDFKRGFYFSNYKNLGEQILLQKEWEKTS